KEHGTTPQRQGNFRHPTEEDLDEIFRHAGVHINFHRHPPRGLVGSVDISFEESVMGCTKSVSFSRDVLCSSCNGSGCSKCNGVGTVSELKEASIELPPGVEESGSFARIQGGGGFVQGQNADAIIEINVIPDPDLKRSGMDVIYYIKISLLEALKGTSKETRTAFGNKKLKIR